MHWGSLSISLSHICHIHSLIYNQEVSELGEAASNLLSLISGQTRLLTEQEDAREAGRIIPHVLVG